MSIQCTHKMSLQLFFIIGTYISNTRGRNEHITIFSWELFMISKNNIFCLFIYVSFDFG